MKIKVNNGYVETDDLTNEEREELRKALDVKEWPQETVDNYWFVGEGGKVDTKPWFNSPLDFWRGTSGNMFRTHEEAQAYRAHLKVCAELRKMADWDGDNIVKYFAECTGYGVEVCPDAYSVAPHPFKSKESCQHAIDTIGQERLIKYYFGFK